MTPSAPARSALTLAAVAAGVMALTLLWLQVFWWLAKALGLASVWTFALGVPLWLALPVVLIFLSDEAGKRRTLSALERRAAGDPRAVATEAARAGVLLGLGHDWVTVRARVLPLLRPMEDAHRYQLARLAELVDALCARRARPSPSAARPGAAALASLRDSAELEDEAIEHLRALSEMPPDGAPGNPPPDT